MEKIKIVFTPESNILDIWLDEPGKEAYCSETDDDVILRKDKDGHVIGFEILNFLTPRQLKEDLQNLPPGVSIQHMPL